MVQEYTRQGPKKVVVKEGDLAGQRVVIGVSAQAALSKLAVLILKSQGADVRCVHFQMSELYCQASGREAGDKDSVQELQSWAKKNDVELDVKDLTVESSKFAEAWLRHYWNQVWLADIHAILDSKFLLPQLLAFAKEKKAKVATGHRARISQVPTSKEWRLLQSKGYDVDQSFALSLIKPSAFKDIVLPLGQVQGDELLKVLKEKNIVSEEFTEAQLFRDMNPETHFDVLAQLMSTKEMKRVRKTGYFINTGGDIYGKHEGLVKYNVGEEVSFPEMNNAKRHVLGHDLLTTRVIVGKDELLRRKGCVTGPISWTLKTPDFRTTQKTFEVYLEGKPSRQFEMKAELLPDSCLRLSCQREEDWEHFFPRLGSHISLYSGSLCVGSGVVLATLND